MKVFIQNLPAWLKVLIYFLALWGATLITGILPMFNDFAFFFLVSLALSWIFLTMENKSLLSLGFIPLNKKQVSYFFNGLGIGALMLLGCFALTVFLTKDTWLFNCKVAPMYLIMSFLICLWSAFVQEFVFRGYPFQTLLKRYSPWIVQLIIAIPFGLMHLMDHKMSSSDIAITMLCTGIGSVLFGLAYIKTKSLMLPIGIHLGWNYLQLLIPRASGGGNSGLIIINSQATYGVLNVVIPYIIVALLSILILWMWKPATSIKA
ncbi:CPBP family intramembrane metalloprotease [Mucilaginibacter mali]|uniref:CPBP family intramembrane metalloprotease n=1 Tax=Mucilaginibacter mali TaxID=2740462 RepID=A0A7D4TTI9_9SPHI|nr:type II CAAX endopeptidase family protein [Mucilaginibacter mali]QKJ29075.1 CPBP family intramembrane metalloprotease [Mucilaginibacter mali]